MSGSTNPLSAPQTAPSGPAAPNPLTSANGAAPASPGGPKAAPTVAQAMAHITAQNLGPGEIAQHIGTVNYTGPELGKLLQKSNLTRKDVVKATADAVGARKVNADEAIKFISSMPEKPEQLRPWLQQLYQANLVAAVAFHSVGHQMLAGGQGAPQGPGMPVPGVPQSPGPNALAAPGQGVPA